MTKNFWNINPYNQFQAQSTGQQLMQAMQQSQIAGLGLVRHQTYNDLTRSTGWMWNGEQVSLAEFAIKAYGENTPEHTMFLLKYAEIKQGETK